MNRFDATILEFFNQFAQRSSAFDSLVVLIGRNSLVKGGLMAAVLWWAWFRYGEDAREGRQHILPTIVAAIAGVLIARASALILPFRTKPLHTIGLDLRLPETMDPNQMWSSFPSDHAVLFFALATGIYFLSRPLGAFLFGYVFVVICLTRIYRAIHWPTDILAGMLLGIGLGWLANLRPVRELINRPAWRWRDRYPGLFYAALFLLTYQIATLFTDSLRIASYTLRLLSLR